MNFHQVQFYDGIIPIICKDLKANVENFHTFLKQVTFTPWYGQSVLRNTLRVTEETQCQLKNTIRYIISSTRALHAGANARL